MKTLLKYFENRLKNINLLLELPDSKFSIGKFHKLRVEIKKLNALFELVNFCVKDFKFKKTFKPIKFIFQQAGIVRELQLEETMLKKYLTKSSLKSYRSYLNDQRVNANDDFFKMIKNKKFIHQIKKYQKVKPFINKVNGHSTKHYLELRINSINNLIIQSTSQPQQLHEIRKRLKTLNYNMRSLPLSQQKQTIFKKDIMSGLLGRWHDCQVMIDHLERAMRSDWINKTEVKRLTIVKRKISSNIIRLLSKINVAIVEQRHMLKQQN